MANDAFSIDFKGIDELAKDLDPKRFKKAVTRTINKTAAQANTALSKKVRRVYNIKAKDWKAKVRIIRAKAGHMVAVIRVEDRHGTPLISYSAKQTKKGITYKVRKAEGRKTEKGAFIAKMQSGHRGVFERYGEKVKMSGKSKYFGKMRQPLRELFRIDAVSMVSSEGMEAIEKIVKEKMPKILEHELGFELSKGR